MTAAVHLLAALTIVAAITFGITAAQTARLGMARTDRRRLLHLLAEFGPLDGGHLLECTPLSKDAIVRRMAELVEQGLVTHEPSSSDPFWRDLWRITDEGRRVAG